MSTYYVDRRPFASAQDGRPLVHLHVRTKGDRNHGVEVSFVSDFVENQRRLSRSMNGDEPSDREVEQFVVDGMSAASFVAMAAFYLDGEGCDVAALEGDVLVEADRLPEWARTEGTTTVTLSSFTPTEAP